MLIALSARSQKNNYTRIVFGLYAYASGAQRQLIELLAHLGICSSYSLLTANIKDTETHESIEVHTNSRTHALASTTPSHMEGAPLPEEDVEIPVQNRASSPLASSSSDSESDDSIWDEFEDLVIAQDGDGESLQWTDEQRQLNNRAVGAMRELRTALDGDEGDEELGQRRTRKTRVVGILKRLSEACTQAARANASTRVLGFVYDNINMLFHIAEQRTGHKTTQQNGTCATAFGLYEADPENMLTADYLHSFVKAPSLALRHVLLSSSGTIAFHHLMRHTVLSIIVNYGGPAFERFKSAASPSLPLRSRPVSTARSLCIKPTSSPCRR